MRDPQPAGHAAVAIGLALLFQAIALLVYLPILNCFFLYDDISTLTIASPLSGATLWDCFRPMSIGFWRPLPLVISWVTIALAGPSPLAYHLVPVVFHGVNAWLLWRLLRTHQVPQWLAVVGSCAYTVHFSAFAAVSTMLSLMDVLVGTAVLLTLLAADGREGRVRVGPLCLVFLFGILSKETAVVLPWIGLAWWLATSSQASPESRRAGLRRFAPLLAASLVAAGAVLLIQRLNQTSYMDQGKLSLSPISFSRQAADYLLSIIFPFVHTAEFPGGALQLSKAALWGLRALVALSGSVLAVWCVRRRRWELLACLAISVAPLLPACLLNTRPEGRFLYSSIAHMFVLVILAARQGHAMLRVVLAGLILTSLLSLIGHAFSPTVRNYRIEAHNVGVFVAEAQRLSPRWQPGSQVTIYDHPHQGAEPWRWSYCQQLFNLFIPDAAATVALDVETPDTRYAYRFEEGRLVEKSRREDSAE